MTKWQYCEMAVEYGGPLVGLTGELMWYPKGEVRNRRDQLGKLMYELGQEGWELVSTSIIPGSVWGNRRVVHTFKRPITDD